MQVHPSFSPSPPIGGDNRSLSRQRHRRVLHRDTRAGHGLFARPAPHCPTTLPVPAASIHRRCTDA